MKTKTSVFRSKIIVIVIILIAVIFRLWNLQNLPPSLFSDEVDAGYQAMVFNQIGADYNGNKFPIHFQSFSDWRTSGYIYSIALLQRLGINPELSVRLPSALFGIVSVYLLFLITNSPIAAFLLAISPWSIHYSRTGFEVSGMIMTILLGIYLFKKYLDSNQFKYLLFSTISLCLSPYFYSTAKIFLPCILILLAIIWPKKVFGIKQSQIFILIILAIMVLLPMGVDTILGRSGFRFSYISIFTEPHREQVTDNLRYQDALVDHPGEIGIQTTLVSKILHNKLQLVFQRFVTNYVSTFSTEFLLLRGDSNVRHGFGQHGLIYILDSIFIIIGIFYIFIKKPINKLSLLFLVIFIFAPIPFALTRDSNSPHATRLILMLPSLIYFSYLGIKYIVSKNKLLGLPVIFLYLISFYNFFHYYKYHYPQDSAYTWHVGMKESVQAATSYTTDSPLIFSSTYEPFLPFFLFYQPFNLTKSTSIQEHLEQTSNDSFEGQVLDNKYFFGRINWGNLNNFPPNSILIVPKSEYDSSVPKNIKVLQKIDKKYINQEEFYLLSL